MLNIVKRLEKGSALTFEEMDSNLEVIKNELNSRPTLADASMSVINAILNIKDNVSIDGDTLAKLHNLILELNNDKINKTDITNDLYGLNPDKLLCAVQGKVLKDALTSEINNRITAVSNENVRATLIENGLRVDLNKEIINRTAAIDAAVLLIQSNLYSHG